jgi:Ca-activated chloride channel homolog
MENMWHTQEIGQILLITDGCSNQGEDPVRTAGLAREFGIVINVIGIVDPGTSRWHGEREVRGIAEAGGGMCRIVELQELSGTMQMVTQQSMQLTIQQVVNRELQAIVGVQTEQLPPQKRVEVARLIEKASDEVFLRLVLLLDVSASMHRKLPKVREAIYDLSVSLEARTGRHETSVLTYPGKNGQTVTRVCDFCSNPDLTGLMNRLSANGVTPTGPALKEAYRLFGRAGNGGERGRDADLSWKEGDDGIFSSCVI